MKKLLVSIGLTLWITFGGKLPAATVPLLPAAFSLLSVNTNGTLRGPTNFLSANRIVQGHRVETLAQAIALTNLVHGQVVETLGYHAAGDGGHWEYRYDSGSTVTTNRGSSVKPTSMAGALIAIDHHSTVNIRQFGAKGDASTDDTLAIQDAINYAQSAAGVGTVYIPHGTFMVSNLTALRGVTIRGAGWNSRLKALPGATGWMLTLDGNAVGSQLNYETSMAPVVLNDLYLDGNNRQADFGAISLSYIDHVYCENLNIYEFNRSGLFFDKSVRESTFSSLDIRYCGDRTATNNHGGGWPGVSIVDWETNSASVEDKHNGLRFLNSQVVFTMGDVVVLDTYQISNGGRKVSNIAFDNCWLHGWGANFSSVKYYSTMTNSPTMQAYDMFKVGAARDVRLNSTRLQYGGRDKPIMDCSMSTLGGSTIGSYEYSAENVQVIGCYFNAAYSTTRTSGEVGMKSTAGYGIVRDNIFAGLYDSYNLAGGWAQLTTLDREEGGVTFSGIIPTSNVNGTMQELGSRDYTVHIRFRMPTTRSAISRGLFSIGTIAGSVSAYGIGAYLDPNNNLIIIQLGPTGSDTRTMSISYGSLESVMGKIVDLDVVRSGSTLTAYINGGSHLGQSVSTAGSPNPYSQTLTSTKWSIGVFTSSALWKGPITEFRIANRAFAGSELTYAVNPVDMWGSTNAISSGDLTIGARYRITAQSTSDFTTAGASANTVGTEFQATTVGSGLLDASNTVERLGWVLDANLSSGYGTTVYDHSPNNLDGTLTGNGVQWVNTLETPEEPPVPIYYQDLGVAFDGVNASSYIGGDIGNIGTSDFTIHVRAVFPSANPTNTMGLFTICSSPGTITAGGIGAAITTSGRFRFFLYGATTSDYRFADVLAGVVSPYLGKEVDVVITRSGGTVTIYFNGASATYGEQTGGTPPAWSDAVTSSKYNVGLFTSTQIYGGSMSIFRVANRALSASELTDILRGPYPADYGAGFAALDSGTTFVGRRYRIASRTDGNFTSVGSADNNVGTEFVATATGAGILDAGDTAYRIGWVLDLDLEHATTTTARDKGPNGYDGTLTGNGVVPISPSSDNLTIPGYASIDSYLSVTGDVRFSNTITAGGTTGAQTINKTSGTVNFAAGATQLIVTCNLVTTNSRVICTIGTHDSTMTSVQAVAGSGSFVIYPHAIPTAETRVNFLVIN